MKWIYVLALFVVFGITPFASAQDGSGQYFFVHEDVAKPSAVDLYEAELKQLYEIRARTGYPFGHITAQMNGNRFFMFTLIEGPNIYASLQNQEDAISAWYENVNSADRERMPQLAAAHEETHRSYILFRSDELSYTPDTPQANDSSAIYRGVGYNYIIRGKGNSARELQRRFKMLYEEKKIPYRFDVFLPGLGMDATLFIIMSSARDAESLERQFKHIDELLDGSDAEMRMEAQRMTRHFEELRGVMRPDLAYTPNEN